MKQGTIKYEKGKLEQLGDSVFVRISRPEGEVKLPLWFGDLVDARRLIGYDALFDFSVSYVRCEPNAECLCKSITEFMRCEHYVGSPINDCDFGKPERKETAFLVRGDSVAKNLLSVDSKLGVESARALMVADGDMDVWVKGFNEGYKRAIFFE